MSQIKVTCSQSAIDPNRIDISFIPQPNHWGCVDLDELFNELEIESNKTNYAVINSELLNKVSNKLQMIINQWEATNSLWVKELH